MEDKKYSVIVVEDENLIARNIAKNIENENPNFKVVGIYSNGEDAFNAIKKQPPAVVFTDISMPVMTGIELAAKLHEQISHVKCVILTGYADFEYAKAALHYGVEDYLLKPVDKAELHKVLKSIELALSAQSMDLTANGEGNYTPEEIVALVKEYVQNNYAGEIDLNSISNSLGFSSSYLTKVFNKVENTTPSKYIRSFRMGLAKQLLNDRDATIAQVSAAVGYPDPFHFSKTFKQTFGVSPTEYKESL